MRDKLLVALLSVCCTLLVVNVLVLMNQKSVAHGQAGGAGTDSGAYIIATAGTQNDPICFVFHKASQHLVAYSARNGGIKVLGVRKTSFDTKLNEVNKHFSFTQAKKAKATGK